MSKVGDWLEGQGLGKYAEIFAQNAIKWELLSELTVEDLKELGLNIGERRRFLAAVAPPLDGGGRQRALATASPARSRGEAERRQLTVMFCDLVGSTMLSQRFDPEDLGEIVRAYQDCCAGIISRYEGYIARYMGDGILVYFGYPQAHEDDAARALRVGLEIIDSVAQLEPRPGLSLEVRIGVATGPVVVGETVGGGASREQVVLGETPNLAARLQSLAKPNTLVISAATQRLSGNRFELVDLGEHALKGFARPIEAWAVTSLRDVEAEAPADDSVRGLLVGREQELELLRARWRSAREGGGQVVVLSGEPGMGKTRLLEALRPEIGRDGVNQITFRCSSFHTNSAWYPLQKFLERVIGRTVDDGPAETVAKLERMLARYEFADETTAILLAALLGISSSARTTPLPLTPEQQKQQTQTALMTWMAAEAKRQPMLMVWEDVHWADPSSVELVGLLLDRVPTMPLLVVLAARPEFRPQWGARSHLTQLTVSRLGTDHVEAITRNAAGGVGLPAELVTRIAEHTDGVPLFIEEMTKSIVESGVLRRVDGRYELTGSLADLSIPITLHDSLMARLDRVGSAKGVAQVAAAIGREFSYSLLAAVSPDDEAELNRELRRLVDAGLIYPRGSPPEATYLFKHALVQDVAYESLLIRNRVTLHGTIAEAIERQDASHRSAQTALLAHHYARSAQPEKAVEYALRAGDNSMQLHARAEATTYYRQAVSIAQGMPDSAEARRTQIDAMLKLTAVGSSREDSERDAENLKRAQRMAETMGDSPRLAQVLYWLGRLRYARGESTVAADYAEQSLTLADSLGDEALAAPPLNLLGRHYVVQGNYVRAREIMVRSVAQMNRIANTVEEASAAGFAGLAYAGTGEFRESLEYANRGLALALQLKNPFAEAAAYYYRGISPLQRGDWGEATADFDKGLRIAEAARDGFRSYLLKAFAGESLARAGDPQRARALLDEAVGFAEKVGTKFFLGVVKHSLAITLMALGDQENAMVVAREAAKVAEEAGELWIKSRACRLIVELSCRLDSIDVEEATRLLLEAIRIQQEFGCEPELARSYQTYSILLRRQGETERALAYADQAREMFRRMEMVWDMEQADQLEAD